LLAAFSAAEDLEDRRFARELLCQFNVAVLVERLPLGSKEKPLATLLVYSLTN